MTRNNMNPGAWGMQGGKPSITWWRAGDCAIGEPATIEEIVVYDSEAARDEAFVHNMKIFDKNGDPDISHDLNYGAYAPVPASRAVDPERALNVDVRTPDPRKPEVVKKIIATTTRN